MDAYRKMELDEKKRKIIRTSFKKILKKIENKLQPNVNITDELILDCKVNIELLNSKIKQLNDLNKSKFDYLIESYATESEIINEIDSCDRLDATFTQIKLKVDNLITTENKKNIQTENKQNNKTENKTENKLNNKTENEQKSETENKQSNKLPMIDAKQFSGEIEDWLPFWNQFQRIHNDNKIDICDKFNLLHLSMKEGTKGRELLDSFSPTGDNYYKAVGSLESRYGKKDALIEVYTRQILDLVINRSKNVKLSILYDKLECLLRAFEILGVTSDNGVSMLLPLVDSCLPDDVLRAWRKYQKPNHSDASSSGQPGTKERLDSLMSFIQLEVEREASISLAVAFPNLTETVKKSSKNNSSSGASSSNTSKKKNIKYSCCFCKKDHLTENCLAGNLMNLSEKRRLLAQSDCCFICTRKGHIHKECKEEIKCNKCSLRHVDIMCTGKKSKSVVSVEKKDVPSKKVPNKSKKPPVRAVYVDSYDEDSSDYESYKPRIYGSTPRAW